MCLFFYDYILRADVGSAVFFFVIMVLMLNQFKEGQRCLEMEQVSALDAAL